MAASEAFRRHFDRLADAIAAGKPERIARKLCTRGVLPKETLQSNVIVADLPQYSRALLIMSAVEKRVCMDPSLLQVFLKVLKKNNPTVVSETMNTYSKSRRPVATSYRV